MTTMLANRPMSESQNRYVCEWLVLCTEAQERLLTFDGPMIITKLVRIYITPWQRLPATGLISLGEAVDVRWERLISLCAILTSWLTTL